jgi:hypothetical protein
VGRAKVARRDHVHVLGSMGELAAFARGASATAATA